MSEHTTPQATLGTTKKYIPGVQFRAKSMYDGIMANIAMFPGLPITMVAFLAAITALATAQQNATGTRAKGTGSLRNTKRDAVWTGMELLRAYTQGLADTLSAEAAASLIQSAGMLVGAVQTHQKPALTAKLTTVPGVARLDANRSLLAGPANTRKRAMLSWQMSADGGKTWIDLKATPYATTEVIGLTLLSTYSFRVNVTVAKVTGAWSQAVTLLIH